MDIDILSHKRKLHNLACRTYSQLWKEKVLGELNPDKEHAAMYKYFYLPGT